jgi:hypothetical protein
VSFAIRRERRCPARPSPSQRPIRTCNGGWSRVPYTLNFPSIEQNNQAAVFNLQTEQLYVGSKITHVGIPDTNLNQLSAGQLALGSALLQRVPNPYFGIIPRSSSLGDPTISLAQLLKPYPK